MGPNDAHIADKIKYEPSAPEHHPSYTIRTLKLRLAFVLLASVA